MNLIPQILRPPCEGKTKSSQLLFLLDAVLINGAYILTTGTVLSGYIIYLGAGDFFTAILNNSTNFSTILSIFSFFIFEKLKKRKKALITMNIVSRLLMFLIILLPIGGMNKTLMYSLLAIMIIVSDIIWGIYRVGWLIWIMSIVPKDMKSRYVYYRMFVIRIFMSLLSLLSGYILDFFGKGYNGFLVVFGISLLFSILDAITLKVIDEEEYIIPEKGKNAYKMLFQPFLNKEYRSFLLFIFAFYLFQNIATSFTPIFLIKYLKFDYKFISSIGVISMIMMILSNRFWEIVEGRKGFKFVISATGMLLACELLLMSFLSRDTYFVLYVSTIISGIGMGGFAVSIFTFRYSIMPEAGKTMYEGSFYFATGISMFMGPFLGRFLMSIIPEFTNSIYMNSKIQLLYMTAFILLTLLISINYLVPIFRSRGQVS